MANRPNSERDENQRRLDQQAAAHADRCFASGVKGIRVFRELLQYATEGDPISTEIALKRWEELHQPAPQPIDLSQVAPDSRVRVEQTLPGEIPGPNVTKRPK